MTEHRVRLHEPRISGQEVRFEWEVSPRTDLYQAHGFSFQFPPELEVSAVPRSLWLRLGMLCLHAHWALLAPCRVELPYYLGPGEREFWQRLIDVVAIQVHAYGGSRHPGRAVELHDDGPALPPETIEPRRGGAAAGFSGGKDSLVQTALLAELTDRPLLVTATSPVPWSRSHVGAPRARAMSEITRRLDVELVEVRSDLRACWRNEFAGMHGCVITVNELTDVMLYQATTLAAAAAQGIPRALLASEADIQYNASRRGEVIQHMLFACAASTHAALNPLLSRFGLSLSSLTYPLHMQYVEGLLWGRYRKLRDLQFSCWQAPGDAQACSVCGQCLEVGMLVLGEGFSPTEVGIDPVRLLRAWADPPPSPTAGRRPTLHPMRSGRDKFTRVLQRLEPERLGELLASDPRVQDAQLPQALADYRHMRERALGLDVAPEPGYVEDYLQFVDPAFRRGVGDIFAEHFPPAQEGEFTSTAARAQSLARWVAAPLGAAHGP